MELYCTFRDEQPYKLYSDHQSFVYGHDARNEGGQTKERERAMESKQRHTTSPRRAAWRYLPGPSRVCGSRNGNRSSSILAVAFEDRYTLQSVVTVGGPRRVEPRFTFRTNRKTAFPAAAHPPPPAGNRAFLGLKWMLNVDAGLTTILQTIITTPRLTGRPRLTSVRDRFQLRLKYETR